MQVPGILIAAMSSGAGKTMVACGLMKAWQNKGLRVAAFKCGPDYIDPMFHREVLGCESFNLDTFLCSRRGVKDIFSTYSRAADLAVVEGVMGYYDGLAGVSVKASTYEVADSIGVPAVLVVDCRGASVSIAAWIRGMLEYRENSHIKGVILNRISPALYGRMKTLLEEQLPVKVYGFVPHMEECTLKSRYLGLRLPYAEEGSRRILEDLGRQMEQTVDLDGLLRLAERAEESEHVKNAAESAEGSERFKKGAETERKEPVSLRVALARDEAFCFMYEDNLRILKEKGACLVPFSPLRDGHLPEDIDGLLLYGGYPELYAGALSENRDMQREIRNAVKGGLPCMAECGGFMYLQESMEDQTGACYPMAGALEGKSFYTPSLKRFGYVTLSGGSVFGRKAGEIPAHEFHYYESSACGDEFCARKPLSECSWDCMVSTDTLLAGYPHICYRGAMEVAEGFLEACRKERQRRDRCQRES